MKKFLFLSIAGIAGAIAFPISFFRYVSLFSPEIHVYWIFGVIMAVILTSSVISIKKLIDEIKGIPADDEMTNRINREAAFQSVSSVLSLWILLLLAGIWIENPVVLIGAGIFLMTLIYAGYWFYFRIKGVTDDDK